MIQNLEHLHFKQKRHLISEYIIHCYIYDINRNRNQKPIGSFQPIQISFESIHTIIMDFIIGLSSISSQDTL